MRDMPSNNGDIFFFHFFQNQRPIQHVGVHIVSHLICFLLFFPEFNSIQFDSIRSVNSIHHHDDDNTRLTKVSTSQTSLTQQSLKGPRQKKKKKKFLKFSSIPRKNPPPRPPNMQMRPISKHFANKAITYANEAHEETFRSLTISAEIYPGDQICK